jgi:hypothetical protein
MQGEVSVMTYNILSQVTLITSVLKLNIKRTTAPFKIYCPEEYLGEKSSELRVTARSGLSP